MTFSEFVHSDKLFGRIERVMSRVDEKMDEAFMSDGCVEIFASRMRWSKWCHALYNSRLRELRAQYDASQAGDGASVTSKS